ncbi:MAG: HNH endonuclease, partial [Frankia sp.]|nr:HNH endonuclease [Frankia sp.]
MFEDEGSGSDTLTATSAVADLGALRALSAPEKVEALVDLSRQIGHLQHVAARLAASIGDEFPGPDDWGREEVGAALRISSYLSNQLLTVGRALRQRLPLTAAALDAGDVSYRHAVAMVELAAPFNTDDAEVFEATTLPMAMAESAGRFARDAARLVIDADPEAAKLAHAHAVDDRDVVRYAQPHGMATVAVTMAAEDSEIFFRAVDAEASPKGPDDDRPIGARRADVVRDWALSALAGTGPGAPGGTTDGAGPSPRTRQGRPVQINVTMTLATALGLADHAAELSGYGPITADAARELARDADWRAFVTDAAGKLGHVGTASYTPSQQLRDLIAARDPVCAHPYCNQPVARCDIDHAIPWPRGETCECNCGPVCRRHHRCKHEGGWQLR